MRTQEHIQLSVKSTFVFWCCNFLILHYSKGNFKTMEVHLRRRWNVSDDLRIVSTHKEGKGISYNERCAVHSPEIPIWLWKHRLKWRPHQKLNGFWSIMVFCNVFSMLQRYISVEGGHLFVPSHLDLKWSYRNHIN